MRAAFLILAGLATSSLSWATSFTTVTSDDGVILCSANCGGDSAAAASAGFVFASVLVNSPCSGRNCSLLVATATFSVDYLITGPTGEVGFLDYWVEETGSTYYQTSFSFTGATAGSINGISNYQRLVFTYGTPFTLKGSAFEGCDECYMEHASVGIYQPMYIRDSDLQIIGTILPNSGATAFAFPSPEPSTLALLSLGAGLLWLGKRHWPAARH